MIQSGWGFIMGAATASINEAITFPVAFDDDDVDFVISPIGVIVGSDPATRAAVTSNGAVIFEARGSTLSKTGVTIYCWMRDAGHLGSTTRYAYSWIAIGKKAR
jgi:hypothetical protein